MDLTGLFYQLLTITSTFNIKLAIILYFLCMIGEVGFGLPYILETIWLLAGYQLVKGTPPLSVADLLMIWVMALAGRQTGSLVLYYSGMLGMAPVRKFYRRFIESRLPKRQIIPIGFTKFISNPSPLSIAAGRLIGLRLPISLTMSARQRFTNLALGVLISSVVWDGIYLVLGGTLGAAAVPNPEYMMLYSLGGLTGLYLTVLSVRYLLKARTMRKGAA